MRIKKQTKYLVTICMAAGCLAMVPAFSSEAAVNAGITASLNQSLISNTAVSSSDFQVLEAAASAENNAICGYKNLGVADVEGHLNVRDGAGEDCKLIGKMPKNAGCEILETEGDWFKIKSGKVTGYVKGEYLLTGEAAAERAEEVKTTIATTNVETAFVRVEPNTDCTIWTALDEGEDVEVLEDLGDWVKVDLDGDECYVFGELVDLSEQLPKAMTMTEIRYGQGVSNVRVDLVNYALQFVGNRYKWGGSSLTKGTDCSGFTMRVYEKYGISLPHHAASQAGYGTRIKASEAQPGDLFFYSKGGRINHVAIYIGNGQVVHASSPRSGIKISSSTYRTPAKVVRLLD